MNDSERNEEFDVVADALTGAWRYRFNQLLAAEKLMERWDRTSNPELIPKMEECIETLEAARRWEVKDD